MGGCVDRLARVWIFGLFCVPGGFGWLVWVCLFSSGLLDFGVFCVDWFGLRDLVGGVHWSLVAGFGVVSWCFVNLLVFGVFGGLV